MSRIKSIRSLHRSLLALLATALLLAACGGDEEPTPTPLPTLAPTAAPTVAPTNTPAPSPEPTVAAAEEAPAQAESPLGQPTSPLGQPDSPLAPPTAATAEEEAARALAQSTQPAAPQAGMASVSGVLFSYGTNAIVPGTQFYLTPADEVDGQLTPPAIFLGPIEEQGDVLGFTTDTGEIRLDNVPPGNYYLLVWTVYDFLLGFTSRAANELVLVQVEPGDQVDLDVVYVNWP
jgi:hypothetical protein